LREQIAYLHDLKRLADFKFGTRSVLFRRGASGMVVDLLLYALLLRAGITLPVARALAIFIAMSWNFTFNRWSGWYLVA
jgi:hypothetical protein